MTQNKINLTNVLTLVVTLLSLISTIIYGTWFVYSIEKRVAILENDMAQYNSKIEESGNDMKLANVQQDHSQHWFEDQINRRLFRSEKRIDGLYELMDQNINCDYMLVSEN